MSALLTFSSCASLSMDFPTTTRHFAVNSYDGNSHSAAR
jgi:hypothetical protein